MKELNSYDISYHLLFETGREETRNMKIIASNEVEAKTNLQNRLEWDEVKELTILECNVKSKVS